MEQDTTNRNNSIDKAYKLVSIILDHYDNNPNCEHCKSIFKDVFE